MLGIGHIGTSLVANGIDVHGDQAGMDKGRQGRSKHVEDVDRNLCNPHEDTQDAQDKVVLRDAVSVLAMGSEPEGFHIQ